MSSNPPSQAPLLVDTSRAISSSSSPALVVPLTQPHDPSLVAPGGKWYMVYVPPGGSLPIAPLPLQPAAPLQPSPEAAAVAVAEATSSTSSAAAAADELPRRKLGGKGAGKSRRLWREVYEAKRQMTTPSFHQPPTKYRPRSFAPSGYYY